LVVERVAQALAAQADSLVDSKAASRVDSVAVGLRISSRASSVAAVAARDATAHLLEITSATTCASSSANQFVAATTLWI
jgi:hypothetical protein